MPTAAHPAEPLRALRQTRSQRALAKALDVPESTLRTWIAGKPIPPDVLARAHALLETAGAHALPDGLAAAATPVAPGLELDREDAAERGDHLGERAGRAPARCAWPPRPDLS